MTDTPVLSPPVLAWLLAVVGAGILTWAVWELYRAARGLLRRWQEAGRLLEQLVRLPVLTGCPWCDDPHVIDSTLCTPDTCPEPCGKAYCKRVPAGARP